MNDSGHRYTDKEVALVLRRAAELEERNQSNPVSGRGLTREQLEEIARDAGFNPEVVSQALSDLQSRRGARAVDLLGASPAAKQVRAVPHPLTKEELQGLMRRIEDRLATPGTVTEALGTVRWTSVPSGHGMQRTTQVSITPTDQETHLQVLQRYPSKLRGILHGLPTAWGAMIGGAIAASAQLTGSAVAGVAVGTAVLGTMIGRTIWQTMARSNERQVDEFAGDLAQWASDLTPSQSDPAE